MEIEKVSFKSNGINSSVKQSNINFKGKNDYTEKPYDSEKAKLQKLMLGATALGGIIALGIAGYKGHLGKGIQKFLGGAPKVVEKESSNLQQTVTKAENEAVQNAKPSVTKPSEAAEEAITSSEKETIQGAKSVADEPKTITEILKEAGITNEKLVKALEEDGTGLKIEKFSRYKDWEASAKELRESGKYGDRIKKIAFIFPEKTKEVLQKEGIDVSNLPKNTYLRQFLDENEKGVYTELVLADDLELSLKTRMVRPYSFGTGCNVFDI